MTIRFGQSGHHLGTKHAALIPSFDPSSKIIKGDGDTSFSQLLYVGWTQLPISLDFACGSVGMVVLPNPRGNRNIPGLSNVPNRLHNMLGCTGLPSTWSKNV